MQVRIDQVLKLIVTDRVQEKNYEMKKNCCLTSSTLQVMECPPQAHTHSECLMFFCVFEPEALQTVLYGNERHYILSTYLATSFVAI